MSHWSAFGRLLSAATLDIVLLACPVYAQESPDEHTATPEVQARQTAPPPKRDPQLGRSENVVVTATRSERSEEDVPVSVTVVPREAIEKAPSRTLDDALRTAIGLTLPLGDSNVIQPTTNHVSMRGLGGDRALVLLDGVPLNDPVGQQVQWNKAPLGTVERVEIVRGAAASLFGNFAMGGTVNILTRSLDPSRVEAEASYGSFDTRRLSASVTESIGAGLTAGVFLDTENTDGYIRTLPQERGLIDIPSSSRSLNLQTKLEARADSGLKTFLRANFLDHKLGQGTPLANNHRQIYDLAAGGRLDLGRSELSANVFYQHINYSIDNPLLVPGASRDAEYLGSHSEQPGRDVGGSLQWSKAIAGPVAFVTAGLDLRGITSDNSNVSFSQSGSQTAFRTSQGHQTFGGLFGEASFFPQPRLEVLLSARLDAWRNTGGREENSATGVTTYEDKSTTRLDPRLSLRYELGDAVAVRGAVYRAFHAPSLSDLYQSSTNRTLQIVANPQLGPESLIGGDIGVDVKAGRFRGQLNVFRNQVDGLIARATLASTPILVVQPSNLGSARCQGVEAMGTLLLGRALSLDAGYAFTDSIVTANPANPVIVGKQVPDVPRNFGSLALAWAPSSGSSVTFRGRAQSQRFGDDANQLVKDSNVVLDLFTSYPLTEALEIFAFCENLLDRQYVSEVNVGRRLGPPRAFFGGLRLRQPLSRSSRPSAQP